MKPHTSRTSLTGSCKTRRLARSGHLDTFDALNDRCRNLATFAELLAACGDPPTGEPLERELISAAAGLMADEVKQLHRLLESLANELAR